jgi:hypothetical protein
VQQILKNDFNLYKNNSVSLNLHFKETKKIMFSEWVQNNGMGFSNVWFSEEAHTHLNGVDNKQNV